MNTKKLFLYACCMVSFLSMYTTYGDNETVPDKAPLKNFDAVAYDTAGLVADILNLIKERHYYGEAAYKKISEGLMAGFCGSMLNALDPHSGVLYKSDKGLMESSMQGKFCGIGVIIDATRTDKDRTLTIVDTIPDGPAEKAGLKALDKIVEIEGEILEGMSTDDATTKLKGEKGSTVTIKIIREGKSERDTLVTYTITRDEITNQNTRCFIIPEHNVCYVAFNLFTETSYEQFEKILQETKKHAYKGIILDLRNNSGGILQAAVDIMSLVVPKGSTIVVTRDKNNTIIERHATQRKPITTGSPFVVVLVNNYTASAAEILAGCLKIYAEKGARDGNNPIVIIAGTKTFGKGSVQEVVPIHQDCAVKLTTSLYFLPDGKTIQGVGIEPDIVIEKSCPMPEHVAWFNNNFGHENLLPNYIKQEDSLETKKEEERKKKIKKEIEKSAQQKTPLERAKESLSHDNQFLGAITIINLLSTIKQLAPKSIKTRQEAVNFLKKNYAVGAEISLKEYKP